MSKRLYNYLFLCISSFLYAQSYNSKGTFKDYAGTTVITSQVRAYRNKAVLRGTEADKNRAFVLKQFTGIQPSVYPGYNGGFWPTKAPKKIKNIRYNTKYLNELVNWGVENNFYILHHCLFFPNKYFPKWFWNSTYSKDELNTLLVS